MGKTLILSEKQLNEIIDGTPYLDMSTNGMPDNIHSNEITTNGGIKDPKPTTTDVIGKQMGKATNGWPGTRGSNGGYGIRQPIGVVMETYTKKDFEKKMLQEMNQGLDGITNMSVTMSDPNGSSIGVTLQNKGTEENLSYLKTKAKQSGNKQKYDAISKVLDGQRERIKSGKKARAAAGMPNQFQKAGSTKNNGGTAHTPKSGVGNITTIQPSDNNQ